MPSPPKDMLVTLGASAAVALAVFAIGTVMGGESLGATAPPREPRPGCHDAPVFGVGRSAASGDAVLCVTSDGVSPSARARGLTPGLLYHLVLRSADQPIACRPAPCSPTGAFIVGPGGAFGRADSQVAGSDGTADFLGHVPGLAPARNSQITLMLTCEHTTPIANSRTRTPLVPTAAVAEPSGTSASCAGGSPFGAVVAYALFTLP